MHCTYRLPTPYIVGTTSYIALNIPSSAYLEQVNVFDAKMHYHGIPMFCFKSRIDRFCKKKDREETGT